MNKNKRTKWDIFKSGKNDIGVSIKMKKVYD